MSGWTIIQGVQFFEGNRRLVSKSTYGPIDVYLARRKVEEMKAAGIPAELIRQDYGHKDYAIVVPLEYVQPDGAKR